MLKNNNLQKKLFGTVFIIIGIIIFGVTALVVFFEKNRYQKEQFSRIYSATLAIKRNIADLMPGADLKYLKQVLVNAMSADPVILYFELTDKNGDVLVSDDEHKQGKKESKTATIEHITRPLFEMIHTGNEDKIPSRFVIYASRLNKDIVHNNKCMAVKNEAILDTFWDVTHLNMQLGTFRVGFSRQRIKTHLFMVAFTIMGTGFFILFVSAGVIFWAFKDTFISMTRFSSKISELNRFDAENNLKQRLDSTQFKVQSNELQSVLRLKQVFSELIKKIVKNWDQLEDQIHDLEIRLHKSQKNLEKTQKELSFQAEEKKEIENRLLNVQKLEAVSTLAGGIAHEFNNLFMAITGYASLIQKQSEPGHSNIVKARKILELVDKGSQSVKQLLGFAKSGKYSPGPLNINEVIRMNLEIFKKTRKDIIIHAKHTKGLWMVYADRSQMEHVVMNLLLNASESMPENGQVNIETNNILLEKKKLGMDKIVSGRFVHFSVQDMGKGIETKYLRRVFDPFFTTKPFSSGAGLGLASVYGIIDNHDGFTTVESTVGKGTKFNLFLPAFKEKEKNEKSI